jgi:hypothetical protein
MAARGRNSVEPGDNGIKHVSGWKSNEKDKEEYGD